MVVYCKGTDHTRFNLVCFCIGVHPMYNPRKCREEKSIVYLKKKKKLKSEGFFIWLVLGFFGGACVRFIIYFWVLFLLSVSMRSTYAFTSAYVKVDVDKNVCKAITAVFKRYIHVWVLCLFHIIINAYSFLYKLRRKLKRVC